jgi:hypothetical protein
VFLYNNYSGQKEEELFRKAEEARFKDKNSSAVHNIQYSNIDKSKIGVKPEELKEIINNPTKKRQLREGFDKAFKNYDQFTYLEHVENQRKRLNFNETLMEVGDIIFKEGEKADPSKFHELQYSENRQPDYERYNQFWKVRPEPDNVDQHLAGEIKKDFNNNFYHNCYVDMRQYEDELYLPCNTII